MKLSRKILLLMLVICMVIPCIPVSFAAYDYNCTTTEKVQLEKFLNRFQWYWYGDYNCLDPAASTSTDRIGILSGVISSPLAVNYDEYPVTQPDLSWDSRKDPKKKWDSFWKIPESSVNWVLKNIYSCSDEQIAAMRAKIDQGVDPFAYRYNGYYYTCPFGTGGFFITTIESVKKDDYYYRVQYKIKSGDSTDEVYESTGYAVFKKVTVDGKTYWQMKSNTYNKDSWPIFDTPFLDVPNGEWYGEPIYFMYKWGFAAGTGEESFSPSQVCNRAQAVTFLWRRAGEPEPGSSAPTFKDVPAGQYYSKAVSWAAENGITGGVGDGYFAPNQNCSRAEIVTFMYRAEKSPSVNGYISFTDVPSNAFYFEAVRWAVTKGITSGTGDHKFSPMAPCTRAQIVTLLYRANSYL